MRKHLVAATALFGAAFAAGPSVLADDHEQLDSQTIERLRSNSGTTLQWIGWDDRGVVMLRESGGELHLAGGQIDPAGAGTLWLDGKVTEAGPTHFTFEGLIRISNTPDAGRTCEARKSWHFAITQNRKYYRLREFEWCDGLTDYIDIYF